MGTIIVSGHNHVWAQIWVGTNVTGHKSFWHNRVGPIMYGHNRAGTIMYGHNRAGTIMYGHNRVGTIMYGHNRVGTTMYGHNRVVSGFRKRRMLTFSVRHLHLFKEIEINGEKEAIYLYTHWIWNMNAIEEKRMNIFFSFAQNELYYNSVIWHLLRDFIIFPNK